MPNSADYANYGSAATSAAGILSDAFSGSNYKAQNRATRKSYKYALRYQPGISDAMQAVDEKYRNRSIQGKVADAKAAGLHPLYALGASTPGGGSSPSFQIPGQSSKGGLQTEGLSRALGNIGQQQTQRDIVAMQLAASALEIAKQQGNDKSAALAAAGVANPHFEKTIPGVQERELGEVQAKNPKDWSQNMSRKSIWTPTYVIPGENSEKGRLMIPGDDIGEVADSIALALATYYHPYNKPKIDALARKAFPHATKVLDTKDKVVNFVKEILASSARGDARRKRTGYRTNPRTFARDWHNPHR